MGRNFIMHDYCQHILMIALAVALFMPDLWQLSQVSNDHDDAKDAILLAAMVAFSVELVLMSTCTNDYPLSFFFWTDIIGTVSMIFDISWFGVDMSGNSSANASLLRAARAAKIGARSGRLMKMFKNVSIFSGGGAAEAVDDSPIDDMKVSNISKRLTGVISRRVAALLMITAMVMPLLSNSEVDYSVSAFLSEFNMLQTRPGICGLNVTLDHTKKDFVEFYKNHDIEPINLTISHNGGTFWKISADPARQSDAKKYTKKGVTIYMNHATVNNFESVLNILTVLVIVILLLVFSALFSTRIDALAVQPIQRMLFIVNSAATNILESMDLEDFGDEEVDMDDNENEGQLETEMLEKVLNKMTRIIHLMNPNKGIELSAGVNAETAAYLQATYAHGEAQAAPVDKDKPAKKWIHPRVLKMKEESAAMFDYENLVAMDFTVTDIKDKEQTFMMIKELFKHTGLVEHFAVQDTILSGFLRQMCQRYDDNNQYHCWTHACDVVQSMWRLHETAMGEGSSFLDPAELYALMIAAIAHDVSHPGVNNSFLVTTKHDLALLHNDRSPLENMHCAVLYQVLRDNNHANDVFTMFETAQWVSVRKVVIHAILGTDMVHHFRLIGDLNVMGEMHNNVLPPPPEGRPNADFTEVLGQTENKMLMIEAFLHCADVSNPIKPFTVSKWWSMCVIEEFFAQGDQERELGLTISPLCDRYTNNRWSMQFNFIDFVIAGLYAAMIKLFPMLGDCGANLTNNAQEWFNLWLRDVDEDRRLETNKQLSTGELDAKRAKEEESFRARLEKLKGKFQTLGVSPDGAKKRTSSVSGKGK